jgi:hypothetical protein
MVKAQILIVLVYATVVSTAVPVFVVPVVRLAVARSFVSGVLLAAAGPRSRRSRMGSLLWLLFCLREARLLASLFILWLLVDAEEIITSSRITMKRKAALLCGHACLVSPAAMAHQLDALYARGLKKKSVRKVVRALFPYRHQMRPYTTLILAMCAAEVAYRACRALSQSQSLIPLMLAVLAKR